MEAERYLLSDAGMQQFIAQGYIQVQADFPGDQFDAELCRQIDAVLEAEGFALQQRSAAHPRHRPGLCTPRDVRSLDQYSGRGLSAAPAALQPPHFPRQRRPDLAQGRLYLRPEYPLSPLSLGHGLLLPAGRHPGYGSHRRDAGAAVVQRASPIPIQSKLLKPNWACAVRPARCPSSTSIAGTGPRPIARTKGVTCSNTSSPA